MNTEDVSPMTDITTLIADLRVVGKTWRDEIGDFPLFDRAADALEALTAENESLRQAHQPSEPEPS
jgi:hypothetical protein